MGARLAKKFESTSKSFEQILVSQGILSQSNLNTAQLVALNKQIPLAKVLVSEGYVTDTALAQAFSEQNQLEVVDLTNFTPEKEVLSVLTASAARKYSALPLRFEDQFLKIAISDPTNIIHLENLGRTLNKTMEFFVAPANQLLEALDRAYPSNPSDAPQARGASEAGNPASGLKINIVSDGKVQVEDWVNQMISKCSQLRASDIHIEVEEQVLRVRARIDGVLHEVTTLKSDYHMQVISRLKVLAGLDIAEKRNAQDGSFQHEVNKVTVDLRLSTLPTVRGEKAVLRILDKSVLSLKLEALGMFPSMLSFVKQVLDAPHGLVLITGPTGSGKTTTVYSMLNYINSIEKNIITVEDPVEFQLGIINQVQVNVRAGLTFANVLRNILRQDPDIIMVGEIRDKETADLAIRAALTGHLVISTIHTNDSVNTVTRLIDMGIEPFMVSSALAGVISQRLVRKLCPDCKIQRFIESKDLVSISPAFANLNRAGIFEPGGCPKCFQYGYTGRQPIFEFLVPTPQIRKSISSNASPDELASILLANGFQNMRIDGIQRVLAGSTSLDEVLKATA